MDVISYKCPNCGADLKFDPATQRFVCEYCMSSFDKEALEEANPQAQKAQEESAKEAAKEQQKQTNGEAVVYSCPSCGAEIVADDTTAATFCYYCHNPVVLQGRLAGAFTPDRVIPFTIDRKTAVESFLKYVRSRRFVPRDFFSKEQIEKITGVYFPFWMYGCRADARLDGEATQVNVHVRGDEEFTETKVFHFDRDAEVSFACMLRDALSSENRELVEAVQPFQIEKSKEFAMGYLSGFQAQKRNIECEQLRDDVQAEVQDHAEQMVKSSVSGFNTVTVHNRDIRIRDERWKYLLLPVWVLTYRGGDGKTYYYAMNGQTGKVAGILPLARGKMVCFFAAIAIFLMLILMIGGYFLW
ncbi:MAG: TFIIB-type zinc ribbon-containing protein [Eubacteriales bacterium]|nr:TFIIB-type zinc ribbon-containing protein [Eubacteriales bacterium]